MSQDTGKDKTGDTFMLENEKDSDSEQEVAFVSISYLKSIRNTLINSPVFKADDLKESLITEDEISLWENKGLASLPEPLWNILENLDEAELSPDICRLILGLAVLYCKNTEGLFLAQVKLDGKYIQDKEKLKLERFKGLSIGYLESQEFIYDLDCKKAELAVLKAKFNTYDVLNTQQKMKINCLRENGLILESIEEELFAYYSFVTNGNTKISCPYD